MTADMFGHNGGPGPAVTVNPGSGLTIGFAEHYSRDITDYDFFPMDRKRNFLNMAEKAAETLRRLLEDPTFAFGLMSLQYGVSLPAEESYAILPAAVPAKLRELMDPTAVAMITAISDEEYARGEVDVDTDHAGRNEELQFTNDHARAVLRWSMACVALSPVLTTVMNERDIRARDSVPLLMDCFSAILPPFEPEGVDLLAKLRKLAESRVFQTSYSDKVMWHQLRNVATDPHIFAARLFRRFVVEGVPKLNQGTNIIRFFQTYLKNQIRFTFETKFDRAYRPVRADVMDGDGVSAMEQLEVELVRRDEGAAAVGEAAAAAAVRQVWRELGGAPEDAEVRHWAAALRRHGIGSWQRSMVTKFFLPRFGRVELVRTRSLHEFARMLLATRAWCASRDLPALASYLGSYAAREQVVGDKRLASRKRFVREFTESAQYRELLGRHFGLASQAVVDSGIVMDMISAVHCGQFFRIARPGELEPDEPEAVEHRIEEVAQEVLRFVAHAACPRA